MPTQRRQTEAAPPAPTISEEQEFLATYGDDFNQTTQEPIPDEQQGLTGRSESTPAGIVTHTRAGLVTMYKPDGRGHYSPRQVLATNIKQNLDSGFKAHCPECGGDHGSDPNACTGREPIRYRECPVCGKKVWDNMDINPGEGLKGGAEDPNRIVDAAYASSTPEERTKVMLDTHIWLRHPQSARVMRLRPLSSAVQEAMGDVEKALGGF